MSHSLEYIVKKIAQSEEKSKEFLTIDNIKDIYDYFKNMGLGISEEDFYAEISQLIYNFDFYNNQLDKRSLENVAGGINLNKNFNKVIRWLINKILPKKCRKKNLVSKKLIQLVYLKLWVNTLWLPV